MLPRRLSEMVVLKYSTAYTASARGAVNCHLENNSGAGRSGLSAYV